MCGIVGCSFEARDVVKRALSLLAHRGPDGTRILHHKNATLGAVRLAIQDTRKKAMQPMVSDGGDIWAALNGEVYNSPQLRSELKEQGYAFETLCDTETVLNAYLHWGEACFSRFEGMFAIVIQDCHKNVLHLARDNPGIKPLYYSYVPSEKDGQESIIFASEIKAILEFPDVSRQLDRRAIAACLAFRFVPFDGTFFTGIRRLPPGHHLRFERGRVSRLVKYPVHTPPLNSPEKQLPEALRWSVGQRLQSDVPLGIYLSGGLDSSIVAALCAEHLEDASSFHSFTITMSDDNTEAEVARAVADELGFTHHHVAFHPSDMDAFSRVAWFQDDLTFDSELLAHHQLAQEASQFVKVVLTGDGADELFGGYAHYLHLERIASLFALPSSLRRLASGALRAIPLPLFNRLLPYPTDVGKEARTQTAALLTHDSKEAAYVSMVGMLSANVQPSHLTAGLDDTLRKMENALRLQPGRTFTDRVMLFEQEQWLPHHILNRLDRMTMCCSLEGRVPYLASGVRNCAHRIPHTEKVAYGNRKLVLRRIFGDVLPKRIARRQKYPFFFHGDSQYERLLAEEAEAKAKEMRFPSFLDRYDLLAVVGRMDGSLIRQRQAFSVVMLLHWLEQYHADR